MQYKLIFLYESDSSHTLSWLCVEERILKLKEKHMLKDFCFPQYYLQEKKGNSKQRKRTTSIIQLKRGTITKAIKTTFHRILDKMSFLVFGKKQNVKNICNMSYCYPEIICADIILVSVTHKYAICTFT